MAGTKRVPLHRQATQQITPQAVRLFAQLERARRARARAADCTVAKSGIAKGSVAPAKLGTTLMMRCMPSFDSSRGSGHVCRTTRFRQARTRREDGARALISWVYGKRSTRRAARSIERRALVALGLLRAFDFL
jgi:hypothetical protein